MFLKPLGPRSHSPYRALLVHDSYSHNFWKNTSAYKNEWELDSENQLAETSSNLQ